MCCADYVMCLLQALDAYPMNDVPPSPGIEPDEAPQWGSKPSKGSTGAMHVHAYAPAVAQKLAGMPTSFQLCSFFQAA